MNPYEQAREERIKRNNAMLAQLELKQQVDAMAAPLAAAAKADAQREAHMRAQLAAVEPRQRSTRGSAAQARKALSRQAEVLEVASGDSQSEVSEAEEPSDESQGRGSSRKRKVRDVDAEEEEDYDPLEDHIEADHADSSASEAGDTGGDDSYIETEEPPKAARGKRQRQRQTRGADRQQRGKGRVESPVPATPEPDQLESEDDDFQLQQALAMSLLESQQCKVPACAQAGPSRASPAALADDSSELQQALAIFLLDCQPPAAPKAAQAGNSAAARAGSAGVPKAAAGVKAKALQDQPEILVLQEEDIKPVKVEAAVKDEAQAISAAAAVAQPESASKAAAAAPSKANAAEGKAGPFEAEAQPLLEKQPRAAPGKQEARAQKGRKQPAKGKAIEIHNPADIDKAFDMIAGSSITIKEHLLQKVWADVRGGNLDKVTCHNMLKYAADITDQAQLDRQRFKKLCEHFS